MISTKALLITLRNSTGRFLYIPMGRVRPYTNAVLRVRYHIHVTKPYSYEVNVIKIIQYDINLLFLFLVNHLSYTREILGKVHVLRPTIMCKRSSYGKYVHVCNDVNRRDNSCNHSIIIYSHLREYVIT